MPEHPLGEIHRSRRAAQGGSNDEAEDVHHASDKARVDRVAAGRPVGLRVERVRQQSDSEKYRGDADIHEDQGDHESAPLAQLHEPGRDHGSSRNRRSPVITRRAGLRRRRNRRSLRRHSRHYETPSRLVTCKNHASSDAWTSWSRYTEIPPVTRTRLISATTSRGVPAARVIPRPSVPTSMRAAILVPSIRARARSGSEHST